MGAIEERHRVETDRETRRRDEGNDRQKSKDAEGKKRWREFGEIPYKERRYRGQREIWKKKRTGKENIYHGEKEEERKRGICRGETRGSDRRKK